MADFRESSILEVWLGCESASAMLKSSRSDYAQNIWWKLLRITLLVPTPQNDQDKKYDKKYHH